MDDVTGSEPTPRKSLDEIAAMMAENTMKMRGQLPNEVTEDDKPDVDEGPVVEEDQGQGEGSDGQANGQALQEGDEGREEGQEDAGTDNGDEQEDDVAASPDTDLEEGDDFEIDDDTLFELDAENQVSFKDLKKVYENNRDQAELLETQREAAQEALAERQRAATEVQTAKQAAMAVFKHFEQLVATPYISRPDEGLKTTNPEQYIRHLDAYEQDQQRIVQNKEDLQKVFDQHLETEKELKTNLKKQVISRIGELVPALKSTDEKVRTTASNDIIEAANHYGFSQEEINEATDARLYQMAHDAQQYRKLMAKTRGGKPAVSEGERKTKVRNQTKTLRHRGTTSKQRLTAKARVVKATKVKAQKSGKVDDVADFIAANRKK